MVKCDLPTQHKGEKNHHIGIIEAFQGLFASLNDCINHSQAKLPPPEIEKLANNATETSHPRSYS